MNPIEIARRGWRRAAAALCVLAAAGAAAAEPLPWVDASGLVTASVRYSGVVAALGEPPMSRIASGSSGSRRPQGGNHLFGYPDRGLTFLIEHEQRRLADPPVESMSVRMPSSAATPQGLRVGLPQAEAVRLLESHYRVERRYHFGPGSALSSVHVVARTGAARRGLVVDFSDGMVSGLRFELQDRPWLSASTKRGLGALGMVVLTLAVGWLWVKWRGAPVPGRRRGREAADDGPHPGRLVGAVLVFAATTWAAVAGLRVLKDGGYMAYFGLFMLIAVPVGLLGGGMLLLRSGYRAAAVLGGLVVGLVMLGMLLSKLF